MKKFHQYYNSCSVFDLTIPYKGNEVHRYLRMTISSEDSKIKGNLFTVPVIDNINPQASDFLYCCGSFTIDKTTDSVDYYNYRTNQHLFDGSVVDAIKKAFLEQKESLAFKEYYGYDLSSDYSKKAYQIFKKDFNQMVKYAGEKAMRIVETVECQSYFGSSVKEYVLKTKTNKDVVLARVSRQKAYKRTGFKGSVSIILPKKPLLFMNKAYNEEILNYDKCTDTLYNDFFYNRFILQKKKGAAIESYNSKDSSTEELIHKDKVNFESINKKYDEYFSDYIAHFFRISRYDEKNLNIIESTPVYSLKGDNKILASNPNALAYLKFASAFLSANDKLKDKTLLSPKAIIEFLRSDSPDKDIAKKMLDLNIPAYTVANIIHHYSPWQAVQQDRFADNSKAVTLVKEVMCERSNHIHTSLKSK